MTKYNQIKLFEEKKVRAVYDDVEEKWYFSIVDVCGVLTESKDYQTVRKYWNKLKQRLKEEGNETVTNCHQLKLQAEDGKMRKTDVADTEQLFRLIQSIPSRKAELSTKEISESQNPETFGDHMNVARQGGEIARNARMELEAKTGKPVVSPLNARDGLLLNKKGDNHQEEKGA